MDKIVILNESYLSKREHIFMKGRAGQAGRQKSVFTSVNFHKRTISNDQMRPIVCLFAQNYAFPYPKTPFACVLVKLNKKRVYMLFDLCFSEY